MAQRLDELAVANSDGLLRWVSTFTDGLNGINFGYSDDEYRLLRQNLFERFSSHSTTPSEVSVVPVTPVRPVPKNGVQTSERRKLWFFQF